MHTTNVGFHLIGISKFLTTWVCSGSYGTFTYFFGTHATFTYFFGNDVTTNKTKDNMVADEETDSSAFMDTSDISEGQQARDELDGSIIILLREWYGSQSWLNHRYFPLFFNLYFIIIIIKKCFGSRDASTMVARSSSVWVIARC